MGLHLSESTSFFGIFESKITNRYGFSHGTTKHNQSHSNIGNPHQSIMLLLYLTIYYLPTKYGWLYIYIHTLPFFAVKHSSCIPPETVRLNCSSPPISRGSQSLQANSSISVTPSISGGSSILKAPPESNFRRESSSCKWSKS